jgi:hypothetical protein
MAWWNNVRDAVGLYWWSERVDPGLKRRARLMVNLALSAPQHEGIFPAVFNVKEKRWVGCYWKPSAPYDPSILPKYWDFKSDYYQTASASKTAFYLLRYRRLCEDDARILPFLRSYGEFIIQRMDPNGCLPAWFTPELSPVPNLRFNAEGGIHICFLTELFKATGERRYLAAAERIAGFLAREILPQQRWYDFETFYSCASKPEGTFDAHTGQWPRCTLSMIWAADGLGLLHKATRNGAYLEDAVAVADYMTLYQSVWQPHFIITAYAFGGCLSQNSDAEWLDMRQPLFAEALVRLARLTGRQDYYERGVAALRASFVMVNHPLHVKNKIFPTPNYPPGLMPENIDHEGIPQLPLRSGFDWAEGGALSAAATIVGELGGAYIDPARKACVGVDGVLVKSFEIEGRRIRVELQNQLAALTVPYNKPYAIELRIPGLAAGNWQLVLNSGKPRQVTAKELEKLTIEIEPRAPVV